MVYMCSCIALFFNIESFKREIYSLTEKEKTLIIIYYILFFKDREIILNIVSSVGVEIKCGSLF